MATLRQIIKGADLSGDTYLPFSDDILETTRPK